MLMKPVVAGIDAKRYIEARPDTYLLFPYRVDEAGAHLIPAADMARDYPNAWAYLRQWEAELRARENGSFDDDQWWRFGRHQNLDKQEISKVIVPRLVASLSCSTDSNGSLYLDNVDVGGVAPANGVSPFFLTGVLNGKVANFVFRRTSKPFRGEYRSANKQYIEPIPIPNATDAQRTDIAQRAEELQRLHSARRGTLLDIARRFQASNARPLPDSWLFPDLPAAEAVEAGAPEHLGRVERRAWIKTAREKLVEQKCVQLGQELVVGAAMDASFERGELRFFIDGVAVIERVFVGDAEGAFILAQWKVIASTFTISEKTTGKKLAEALRRVAPAAPEPLRSQVIALVATLTNTEREAATAEAEMNRRLYALYGLTPAEIEIVERG